MAKNLILSYGGVKAPSFFVPEKINTELLPSTANKSLEVPMKSGAYFVNKKYGIRTFTIPYTIEAPTDAEVMPYADQLAEWLDYDEPQKLVLGDSPDRYYMAIINSETDFERTTLLGKGTLEFVCFDPHAYGETKALAFTQTGINPFATYNAGNKSTAPIIEMTFTKNVEDFAILADNEALVFGDFDPSTQTSGEFKPLIINDTGSNTDLWTAGSSVDGGQVMGVLSSNGYSIGQGGTPTDYGTLSGLWHGGSLIKSLNKTVQDFELECQVLFNATAKAQMGRVEVYLLDVNSRKLGKMAIKDTARSMDAPMWDTWIGQVNNDGVSVNKSYGAHYGTFANFNGVIRVERVGKRWTFYIAKIDSTGRHSSRIFKAYTDWKQKYMDKVAAIQIHCGAYGKDAPVDQMRISNVYFREIVAKTATQVNYVFRKGDKLRIDCNTGEILRNGEPYYDELYPSSSFIKFEKDYNGISVSDPTAIEKAKITYTERWL